MAITLTPTRRSLGILAGTEGSVPFVSPIGTLIEDNPNLFWDDSNNRLGIATLSPDATLEVAGQIKITGGTPGLGKVLTSDASGLGTWQVPTEEDGGWTDDGTTVRLTTSTDQVSIGRNPLGTAPLTVKDEINIATSAGTALGVFRSNIPPGCVTIGSTQPTNFCFIVNGAERVRINTTNQQVVIGNSASTLPDLLTPLSLINIDTGSDIFFGIRDAAGTRLRIGSRLTAQPTFAFSSEIVADVNGFLKSVARSNINAAITWFTGNPTPTERMRLNHLGNFGINTTAPNSGLHANGSFAHSILAFSASQNTLEDKTIYMVNTITNAVTLTIQTVHIVEGRIFTIKDSVGNAGTNNITIATEGSQTIDGQTIFVLNVDFAWLKLVAHNGQLFVIG